jgi:hypothetical protein
MKRFSVVTFVLVVSLHIYGTGRLISESIWASKAIGHGQPEQSFLWLKVWSWILQPIPMFLHVIRLDLVHNIYYVAIALTWSVCVAACFGFLVPRLFR